MKKILMYSVRPDEQPAIDDWVAANDIQVDTNTVAFNADTVDLAKGYDGVVIQQHGAIPEPLVYQKLKSFGMKQLTCGLPAMTLLISMLRLPMDWP